MEPGDVFSAPLVALPRQPEGVPWPTTSWPEDTAPTAVSRSLGLLLDKAFDASGPLAETHAVVVIHGGRLVAGRYGRSDPRPGAAAPVGPETTLRSWSVAKAIV